MARSLGQKRASKKRRSTTRGERRTRERAVVTPHARNPGSAEPMKPRQRIAGLVRIDVVKPWDSAPDYEMPTERSVLWAVMEDGQRIQCDAIVSYKKGERERIVENVFLGTADERTLKEAMSVKHRRAKALETARGYLQQQLGKGVPWLHPAP